MEFSMIVWFSMASLIVVLATVKFIGVSVSRLRVSHRTSHNAQANGSRVKFFEIGSEREEIWVPGDLPMSHLYDDEDLD